MAAHCAFNILGVKMITKTRQFDTGKDYFIIQSWWQKHGSFAPQLHHLPNSPDGGIMVEVDDVPTCCGFMYRTDSSICVFEFVVSNPASNKEQRELGLDTLIQTANDWAEKKGYKLIYSSIGIQSYIHRLKKKGFIEADKGQTHMFKEV